MVNGSGRLPVTVVEVLLLAIVTSLVVRVLMLPRHCSMLSKWST
jgi:hypothetical protein